MICDFEWERICKEDYCETSRAAVFGGWLVKHREFGSDNGGEALSMVFISDPDHEWDV
jgi:hypothetical protein